MDPIMIYSLSLLFVRSLFSAEDHRLAYHIDWIRKARLASVTFRGREITLEV